MSGVDTENRMITAAGSYAALEKVRCADGAMSAGWWTTDESDGRIECRLCPRTCRLKPGDRGFCFVRENRDGRLVLSTYGKSTGFCIDPIEKKPLNHFYPGTSVLSFGTAGCNLGCKFCQNWDISKSRETERLSARAEPDTIAVAAAELGCKSVAFTYNDPIVWAEYAIDSAKACRAAGIKTVAVTAGYISPEARGEFFEFMDAANVDLKAFTEDFYHKITYSHLQPVLDTLRYLKHETNVWFEITNLVIPDANDDPDELKRMCDHISADIGDDIPLHFSAFHPDFRMRDRAATPVETLVRAYDIARRSGLKYVYVGNVHDVKRQSTYCPGCGLTLIERDWYQLGQYQLDRNYCRNCHTMIAGRFAEAPGTWGPKRQPVRIEQFARQNSVRLNSSQRDTNQKNGSQTVACREEAGPERARHEDADRLIQITTVPERKERVMSTVDPAMTTATPTVSIPNTLPTFSEEQQQQIHAAACRWVAQSSMQAPRSQAHDLLGDAAETIVHGVFVTLKRGEQLRGCCGVLGQPMLLGPAIDQSAHRTALDDQRFAPVAASELPYLNVDVTVLGPMHPIPAEGEARADFIEVGKHGLVIQSGQSTGLLLPSVPVENNWTKDQFLQAVCRKAGLPIDAWKRKENQLLTFEGKAYGGPMIDQQWSEQTLSHPTPITKEILDEYVRLAATNIAAIAQGATPSYYVPQLPDMTVNAVVISLMWGEEGTDIRQGNALQLSVRPGVPLQSTLFQMCQSVAQIFINQRYVGRFQLGLSLGFDPALHGMGENIHLEGIDTKQRALVINDPRHCAIAFDQNRSPEELIDILRRNLPVGSRFGAVHSLQLVTSMQDLIAVTAPTPTSGTGSRQAAVAGQFYPSEDAARRGYVDKLIKHEHVEKRNALAVMVPHAGLRFSGAVAAEVWQSINIPKTVLILSPKHTAPGVNWSVSPFESWRLSSSTSFATDTELAAKLVEKIPGLVFDAAAHEREHGIEVQLPILEKFAPDTKVVGAAFLGGNWQEIEAAAQGLADVIREMPEPPLLVISSDMNHYAPEEENRRLDRLALDAFQTGDPQKLLDTCRSNHISMCGVIPAAIVLETLRKLGKEFSISEIAYSTSADAGADRNSVVGYAGAIIG